MYSKILFSCLFVLLASAVHAQTRAIGIRAGEPLGVTYKVYTPSRKAIEFVFGTASPSWNQRYYENSFYEYSKYDGYRYRSHRVESTVYLQARYLLHYDIPVENMEGKLQWYWGVGALLKVAKVQYNFVDAPPTEFHSDVHTDIDLGPEGIGGLEYTFEDLPLTAFGEVSFLFELADRPATVRPLGALGIRVKF